MKNLKRNVAITGAAAILSALTIGGAVAAHATTHAPHSSTSVVQQSDGDGEVNDATENNAGAEETNDGPDQGPDANPNEPGHQDANEHGESQ